MKEGVRARRAPCLLRQLWIALAAHVYWFRVGGKNKENRSSSTPTCGSSTRRIVVRSTTGTKPGPRLCESIGPGQRASAIVVGGQPGRYAFKSVPLRFDERQPPLPEVDLGTVVSDGPPADIAAAEAVVRSQHVNEPLYADVVRSSPIAHRRTFAFSVSPDKSRFFINDEVFDENRTDVTIKLGDTEEWTILNQDSQYHDFHIHQTGFLVTEVNGTPTRFDGLRDTFSVPPMKNGAPGAAKMIIPFTNPDIVGRFVFHCHVVKHEDKGMMQVIELRQ